MDELPVCCGNKMSARLELGRFVEVHCSTCGDVVYVKKYAPQKPVLLDD